MTSFSKILAAVASGGTTPNLIYNLQNAFDIGERIWAGYAMNTITFGRLRVQAGVRIESTQGKHRARTVICSDTWVNDPGTWKTASTHCSLVRGE